MTDGTSSRRTALLIIAVLLLGASCLYLWYRSEHDFGRVIGRKWQDLWWDGWLGGEVKWGEYILLLPKGEYGWVKHEDGDVEIFPRGSSSIVSLTAKKGDRARWPFQAYVDTNCVKRAFCAALNRSTFDLGNRRIDAVAYEDTSSANRVRFIGFMFLSDPPILVSIGAEELMARDRAMDVGTLVLNQIIRQTPRDKLSR
jgi:hypothetical protein